MLKKSDNTTTRRQEVGRGLRLSVNQNGDRMDDPATVHELNVLTVVASESYKEFVAGLQKDIAAVLSARPQKADETFFTGKVLKTATGDVPVTPQMATMVTAYLLGNDYIDDSYRITPAYHDAKLAGTVATLPGKLATHATEIFQLIDSVYSKEQLPEIEDGRKGQPNPLNANFHKKAFRELWSRIHQKAIYSVQFETTELISKCVQALDDLIRAGSDTHVSAHFVGSIVYIEKGLYPTLKECEVLSNAQGIIFRPLQPADDSDE